MKDSSPCKDLFFREEASLCTPLSSYSHTMEGKLGRSRSVYSDWVLQRVKEIHLVVGVSCVGFEVQLWLF